MRCVNAYVLLQPGSHRPLRFTDVFRHASDHLTFYVVHAHFCHAGEIAFLMLAPNTVPVKTQGFPIIVQDTMKGLRREAYT